MTSPSRITERQTVNVPELAKMLGVSKQVVYTVINRGQIRGIRLGQRRVVVPVTVAEELLGRHLEVTSKA